jgi:glycosyltransferase involved in cell wall biosynthesis
MHIRFLTGRLDRLSGSGNYDGRLIEALAARGHRVSVVARTVAVPAAGMEWHALPVPDYAATPLWRLNLPLGLWQGGRAIRRLAGDAPDVAVASEHLFLRGHAARFPGVPWVYFPHSFTYPDEIARFSNPGLHRAVSVATARWLQRWAVRHASTTVRLSRSSLDGMMRRLSLDDAGRFTLIPPATWVDGETRRREPAATLRLLVVGALQESKRVDVAIRALAALRAAARWECDVVGDGEERPALEALAASFGRSLPIRFHGARPDVAPFYRRADLLLFPSRLEHAPLVLMEAMRHGLPVLAMDGRAPGILTASHEIVDDGDTGWLARSERDFADRLGMLAADPALVAAAGRRAQQAARVRFDYARHVDRWEALLGALVR